VRVPLALLFPVLLGACAEFTATDALRAMVFLPPAGRAPAAADEAPPDSELPAAAEVLPAEPSLLVTVGRRRVVATLVQHNGEQRLWRSGDGRLALATDGARVVATSGLPVVLSGSRLDGPDPLEEPAALIERPATARRSVDLADADRSPAAMRFGVRLDCRLRAAPVPGALLVEERCGGAASFTNRYWAVPETGGIWRSEQWVGGEEPMLVEVLSPPS